WSVGWDGHRHSNRGISGTRTARQSRARGVGRHRVEHAGPGVRTAVERATRRTRALSARGPVRGAPRAGHRRGRRFVAGAGIEVAEVDAHAGTFSVSHRLADVAP